MCPVNWALRKTSELHRQSEKEGQKGAVFKESVKKDDMRESI